MEKVKVSQQVVDAVKNLIDSYPKKYSTDRVIELHAQNPNAWARESKVFNGMSILDLTLVLHGHYEIIDPVEESLKDNPILSRVAEVLKRQTAKGIEKYGHTVQPDSLTIDEWIDHATEEAADLMVYLQALKAKRNEEPVDYSSLEDTLNSLYSEIGSRKHLFDPREDAIDFSNLVLLRRIAEIYDINLGGAADEKQ